MFDPHGDLWGFTRPDVASVLVDAALLSHPDSAAEFWSPDQPRDWHGRWTSGAGGGFAPAERNAERERSRGYVRDFLAGRSTLPGGAERELLAQHLSRLTVKELHALKAEHGLKASAPDKQALVAKLAERFREHREKSAATPQKGLTTPREGSILPVESKQPTGVQKMTMQGRLAGTLPAHMVRRDEFLAEPHAPAGEPDKVTVKKAPAKLGGGYLVTIHSGGTFREWPVMRARDEADAREKAVASWRKTQSPEGRHRAAVAEALQARKHVPETVLSDYPDLVQRYGRANPTARPETTPNRVPGTDVSLTPRPQPRGGVEKKSAGKLVLDVGPDPRVVYAPGDVIEVGGVPHLITSATAVARRTTPVDGEGDERQWTSNVQTVQARPLTPAELEVYRHLKLDFDRRQAEERARPLSDW